MTSNLELGGRLKNQIDGCPAAETHISDAVISLMSEKCHFSDRSINASPICISASGRSDNAILKLIKNNFS